jgi:hypothetical protein
MRLRPLALLVSLAVPCLSQMFSGPVDRDGIGYLQIHVVDPFGRPLRYHVKSFVTRGPPTGPEPGISRHEDRPALQWRIRLGMAYGATKGFVIVFERNRWLTVVAYPELVGDEIRGPRNAGGQLRPVPDPDRKNWIRLTGAFDGQLREETAIQADGSFKFSHYQQGRFVLTAFSGAEIVALTELTIDKNTKYPITIQSHH